MTMLTVTVHSLYAGHGNFYHIELTNSEGQHRHIIVDAGTMPRRHDPNKIQENIDQLLAEITTNAEAASVILCTTHMDIDHILFMRLLYESICQVNPAIISTVAVTLKPGVEIERSTQTTLTAFGEFGAEESQLLSIPNVSIIDLGVECPFDIVSDPDLDFEFSLLATWLCYPGNTEVNANSSLFFLRCGTSITWFLGDATGETMHRILEETATIGETIAHLSRDTNKVFVTTPHHGSIHSLNEASFLSDLPDGQGINPANFKAFLGTLYQGGGISGLFVNADFDDEFSHPDDWTLWFMASSVREDPEAEDRHYLTYKHVNGGYANLADTSAAGKFWTNYTTKRGIYPAFIPTVTEVRDEQQVVIDVTLQGSAYNADIVVATFESNSALMPFPSPSHENEFAHETSTCDAARGTSFKDLFGPSGRMFRKSSTGYGCFDTEAVNLLALSDYRVDESGTFTGNIDASASAFSCYGWLNGTRVTGVTAGNGVFSLVAPVGVIAPSFGSFPLVATSACVHIDGCAKHASTPAHTNADLVWTATMGTTKPLPVLVHVPLLCDSLSREVVINVGEPGQGSSIADLAQVVADLVDTTVNFANLFPASLPFTANVRLYTVRLSLGQAQTLTFGAAQPVVKGVALTFGYEHTPISNALEYLRFTLGFSLPKKLGCATLSLEGKLTLFGVPLRFTACAPRWQASVRTDLPESLAIAEIAAAWSCSIPSAFARVGLATVSASFSMVGLAGDLSTSTFDLSLFLGFDSAAQNLAVVLNNRLSPEKNAEVANGVLVQFLGGTLTLARTGGALRMGASGTLGFYREDGTYLFGFELAGNLARFTGLNKKDGPTNLILSGRLIPHCIDATETITEPSFPSFASLYTAITGLAAPSCWPTLEITSLVAAATCAETFSITSCSGGMRATLDNRSVFPLKVSVEVNAVWNARAGTCSLAGSFKLGERFTIRARAVLGSASVSWTLELVLGTLLLKFSCKGSKLTATVEVDASLADIVDALLKLFNWEDSFKRTGAWSFLNSMNFKGTKVTYDTATSILRLDVVPSCSSSFLSLESFAVVSGGSGVTFEVAGDFDGVKYPKSKPLIVAPKDLPVPGGNALKVEYLGLGDRVGIPGMNTASVERGLEIVRTALHLSVEPEALTVESDAGILLAADFTVAQAVRVQLLYYGKASFIGGRFHLFGDRAGPLAGLVAEFSYVRISNQLGVFSGEFMPPASLRAMRLGAMTFGLGRLSARIYTNADFEIDLGFPKNSDFGRSFSFTYGVVSGAGGAYIKRHAAATPSSMPATTKGRFTNALQLGLGMRVTLSRGVRAGLLSATAYFMMQGIFEGAYATFIPYAHSADEGHSLAPASATSTPYYRLEANVVLEGRLEGSVNFGLVGASVTVQARATARLVMEAYRAASVSVTVDVRAQAQIRVVFVRIKFSFSLSARIDFELEPGGRAPWDSGIVVSGLASSEAGTPRHPLRQIEPPDRLVLPLPANEIQTIAVSVVPSYSTRAGLSTVAFIGGVSADDFSVIVDVLAQLMEANEYMEEVGTLELFNNARLFLSPAEIEAFLGERFVFEYSFIAPRTLNETAVLMPLPACFVLSVETRYASGQSDIARRNFSDAFLVNDAFFDAMDAYYASTSDERRAATQRRARERTIRHTTGRDSQERVSLARQMFADYFELVITCLRAEHESARVRNTPFNARTLTAQQSANIAGTAMHFFLGGHRVLDEQEDLCSDAGASADPGINLAAPANVEDELAGNFERAGEQVFLMTTCDVVEYRYALSFVDEHPAWVRFAESDPSIGIALTREAVINMLPPSWYAAQTHYREKPHVRSFFRTETVPSFSLPATLATNKARLYDTGVHMKPGERFIFSIENTPGAPAIPANPRWVGLCKINLLKCNDKPLIWSVVGSAYTSEIASWLACKQGDIDELVLLAPTKAADDDQVLSVCSGATSYFVRGLDGSSRADSLAFFEDRSAWLALLAHACSVEQPCFFGFQDAAACSFAALDEFELIVCVVHTFAEAYPHGFGTLWLDDSTAPDELTVQPSTSVVQASVPQGSLIITALTVSESLNEDEQRLYDVYGSLAVRLKGEGYHETPPFVSRDEASVGARDELTDGRRQSVQLPFARSLGADDVYGPVRSRTSLRVIPLWIDLFGNAHEELDLAVTYEPRYVDELIGFCAYPGFSAQFNFVRIELCDNDGFANDSIEVTLSYRPTDERSVLGEDTLEDALLQLKQPDVEVVLDSPLVAGSPKSFDKTRLIGFLQDVVRSPSSWANCTEYFELIETAEGFISVEANVIVTRSEALVEDGAPASVQRSTTRITYRDSAREMRNDEPWLVRASLFEAERGSYALINRAPLAIFADVQAYALRMLPLVSGGFSGDVAQGVDPKTVELNAVDLQQGLERFMKDIASLFEPDLLARFACSSTLGPQLDDAFSLRARAATAIASRLAPLNNATPEAITLAARKALSATLRTKPDLSLPCALVLAGAVTRMGADSADIFGIHGAVGEGAGYPTRIYAADMTFGCVLDTQGKPFALDDLYFKVERLSWVNGNITQSLTPASGMTGFDRIVLSAIGDVSVPGGHRPAAPTIVSVTPAEQVTTVALELELYSSDTIEWILSANHIRGKAAFACAVQPSGIFNMERYRRESPALIEAWDDESVGKLLDLMSIYLDGLETFSVDEEAAQGQSGVEQGADQLVRFTPVGNAEGWLSGLVATGATEQIEQVSYRLVYSEDITMSRAANATTFLFDPTRLPFDGERLILTVLWKDEALFTARTGTVQLAYRPEVSPGVPANPLFHQKSAALSF